jgi:hypothetical protein
MFRYESFQCPSLKGQLQSLPVLLTSVKYCVGHIGDIRPYLVKKNKQVRLILSLLHCAANQYGYRTAK